MSKKLLLEIVTPDRKVLSQDVDYVGAPGALGEFGVLPNHIPFLSALGIGNLYYKDSGKTHYVFVSGGFAEVSPDKVTILAEAAEKAANVLGLRGYAGIDFPLGERPWAVDVNARPTTSIIGIARVMKEEIGELILQAKFGGMPKEVHVDGEYTFQKGELG